MTKLGKIDKIEVPLVQDDLKYPETLIQIANTLDILDQAVCNVFDHVNKSIGKTRQSLRCIEARNNAVSAKIEQLKTIQKSVTILSKGKYPYESSRGDNYVIDFTVAPKLEPSRPRSESESQSRRSEPSGDIENKLKFYHVKTDDMLRRNIELVCEENLGPLPSTIDSVTSCLLFNTCDNVYERYVIVDPLSSGSSKASRKRGGEESTPVRKMEDAPKSLNIEDDLLIRSQCYTFSPSVESVPEISLPTDLPDLVGFADDFRYTGDFEPTVVNIAAVNTDVDNTAVLTTAVVNTAVLTTAVLNTTTAAPTARKPVDHQPPTVSTLSAPLPPSQSKASPTPVATSPPPPPPPLPPPEPPMSKLTESTTVVSDVSSSLHANLMDAIRSAGGTGKAKLRSVSSDVTSAAPGDTAVQTKPPAGDLMSDLAAKLSLRRKGISGSREGGSIMDKLLASIPPPPTRKESSESDGSDTTEPDWDD